MKVEIEGKKLEATRGALLQMARSGEIQPWFYVKSDGLTDGKWVKAGELQFFAGAWGNKEKAATSVRAPVLPVRRAEASRQKLSPSARTGRPSASRSKLVVGKTKASVSDGSGYFELHGFRVNYRISCPKCNSALTRLGVSNCPRCGARLAASKQVFLLKKVLYAICMLLFFASTVFLEKLGDWAKFLYPVAGVLFSLVSVIGRGAKVTVAISIKGHAMPPKQLVIPLNEYYSANAWNKVVERIKSVFKLNVVLKKMAGDERAHSSTGAAPQRS